MLLHFVKVIESFLAFLLVPLPLGSQAIMTGPARH